MDKKLYFENKLIEGVILKRPNRFLMEVLIDEKIEICHCPSTGKIGNITFDTPIPCLLSFDEKNEKRKTKYTVEAISLNNPEEKEKNWIGINQTKANKYIEYFFKTNQLNKITICNSDTKILREKFLGNSKLDFLINDCYLEVKTPLVELQVKDFYFTNRNINIKNTGGTYSTDRFLKHIQELSISLKEHQKAYLITFFMFPAKNYIPPRSKNYNVISKMVEDIKKNGVELWQVNAIFENNGIRLNDYYKMII